jgi:acetyltransferase-like isoleucine patch superfamily enzyme
MHGNGLAIEGFDKAYKIGKTSLMFEPVIMTKHEQIIIGEHSRIDSFVKLEGGHGVLIGDNVHIASFCHVNVGGGTTIIRNGAAMASGAKTISGGNQPEGVSCSASAPQDEQIIGLGSIELCKNSILYAGAIVYAGPRKTVRIGEGARIGANSLALTDVPDHELWAGVPAKFVRRMK